MKFRESFVSVKQSFESLHDFSKNIMKNKNRIVIEGQEWYHEGAKIEKVVGTVRG